MLFRPPDHMCRVIDVFVEPLNMGEAGLRTGRNPLRLAGRALHRTEELGDDVLTAIEEAF